MNSFCGVESNKSENDKKIPKESICYLMTFGDLEREINSLYEELVSLQTGFFLKSEAIRDWQLQVYDNEPKLKVLFDKLTNAQRILEETDNSIKTIKNDLENIESFLKPIEIVTNKMQSASNFEHQRYQMYFSLIEILKETKEMEKCWKNRQEFVNMFDIAKCASLKDIIFYHVRILENIEEKINLLEGLIEINGNIMQFIQEDAAKIICTTPRYGLTKDCN